MKIKRLDYSREYQRTFLKIVLKKTRLDYSKEYQRTFFKVVLKKSNWIIAENINALF